MNFPIPLTAPVNVTTVTHRAVLSSDSHYSPSVTRDILAIYASSRHASL